MKQKWYIGLMWLVVLLKLGVLGWESYQEYKEKQKYTIQIPPAKQYPRVKIDWQKPKLISNLWKISKQGQPDSYLLGTYHYGKVNAKMNPKVTDLVKKVNKIITESPEKFP